MEKLTDSKEIKRLLTETLKKFDEICRDNDFKYSISYGTMLGAVRHKGFIPWDNDIDVVMPRDDYEKFVSLKYDDGNFETKSHRYSKKYHYIFAKFSNKTTYIKEANRDGQDLGLYIDVFPVDFVSSDYYFKNSEKLDKKIPNMIHFYGQFGPNINTPNSELSTKKILAKYAHKALLPISNFVLSMYEKHYIGYEGEYCIPFYYNFTGIKNSFPKEYWDNIIDVPFENITVKMFSAYDEWLTNIYGNYMELPPVEKRTSHSFEVFYI